MIKSGRNVAYATAAELSCTTLWTDWIIRIKIAAEEIPRDVNYELINCLWNVSLYSHRGRININAMPCIM